MTKRTRRRNEQGAVAVVVAISLTVLMAAAAVGVDLARLVYERGALQNALDAAATAAVQKLPTNALQAVIDAKVFASNNMVAAGLGTINPQTALRCVVASNGDKDNPVPDWATVASQCGITSHAYDILTCNESICSLPCTTSQSCNTIIVKYDKTVNYSFGPAIGIPTGQTGAIVSAACRGLCGKASPNPMNVVVMADRTASMDGDDITSMKGGIEEMLTDMTRTQQYVAFGAIHKSVTIGNCVTKVPGKGRSGNDKTFVNNGNGNNATKTLVGTWVATKFSSSYTTGTADAGNIAVNRSDSIYKAVDCMEDYGTEKSHGNYTYPSDASNGLGTHLAAALKGAARYLLGIGTTNNIAALDAAGTRTDLGTPKNVIILETDGRPEELWDANSNTLDLTTTENDPASTDGSQACQNLLTMANKVKAKGVEIITIAYGNANSFTCLDSRTTVRSVLAATAGTAEKAGSADNTCSSDAEIRLENTDDDGYFCAQDGNDLATVFTTAMGSISGASRLMVLPGTDSMSYTP